MPLKNYTFELLYKLNEYESILLGLLFSKGFESYPDRIEILSDVRLKVLRFGFQYEPQLGASMIAWLRTIVIRCAIDKVRHKKGAYGLWDPIDRIEHKHAWDDVNLMDNIRLLESIDVTIKENWPVDSWQYKLYQLHIAGYTYNEIATKLNINMNTLRGTWIRMRAYIRKVHGKEYNNLITKQ